MTQLTSEASIMKCGMCDREVRQLFYPIKSDGRADFHASGACERCYTPRWTGVKPVGEPTYSQLLEDNKSLKSQVDKLSDELYQIRRAFYRVVG